VTLQDLSPSFLGRLIGCARFEADLFLAPYWALRVADFCCEKKALELFLASTKKGELRAQAS